MILDLWGWRIYISVWPTSSYRKVVFWSPIDPEIWLFFWCFWITIKKAWGGYLRADGSKRRVYQFALSNAERALLSLPLRYIED